MLPDQTIAELKRYIKEHYKFISLPNLRPPAQGAFAGIKRALPSGELDQVSRVLSVFVRKKIRPDFARLLDTLRTDQGLSPADLYKAAWVDRRVYSKIMGPGSHPSKDTALQFAFALKLDESDMDEFLQSAGFVLSGSSVRDLVFRFCVERGIHDLHDVNALLFAADQKPLCKEPSVNTAVNTAEKTAQAPEELYV
jgi:hypothetical protein